MSAATVTARRLADRLTIGSGRSRRLSPAVVLPLLALWVVWLLIVLSHPLSRTNLDALAGQVQHGQVERWALVEESDRSFTPLPLLADPMLLAWQDAATPPESASSSDAQIAWTDEDGTHIARVQDTPNPDVKVVTRGPTTPTVSLGTGDDLGERTVSLDPSERVHDVTHLWNGNRLLGPSWLVPLVSLILAITLVRCFEPRHRTRWGWFWLMGAPLGIGFVWCLLREHWFADAVQPPADERPGAWRSLLTALLLAIVMAPVVNALTAA